MYEVRKGDTLGAIARQHAPAGVTHNQMLIALFRNNPDAFIRDNINLVRAGQILNIPDADAVASIEQTDANRLVSAHIADFNDYRSRLAGAPAAAESAPGQRESAGRIEPKPAAAPPAGTQDQLRLSKADPQKPSASGSRAAQGDDAVARERALKEAQSRVTDLEKNVADLQKLLELKNQQLAELEKKAGGKPAAAAPAPAPAPAAKAPEPAKPAAPAPAPAPAAKAPEPAKPAAPPSPPVVAQAPEPAKPAAEPAKPAAEPAKPGAEPAKPAAPAAPAPAAKAPETKPAPKPEPSLLDEFLGNEFALYGLGFVVVLLVGYGVFAWSRKKKAQARFQDSVLGATSGAASVFGTPSAAPVSAGPGASQASVSQPAGMDAEEVDPIAEADVYMAYGRDAQAEEILKEALQKDNKRTAVHVKLLEIYANRKDTQGFEQSAVQLKSLTNGAGPEWEKAAALGRSIDPQNGLYGGAGGGAAAAPAAAAPALDFDLGGASSTQGAMPDISLDAPTQEPSASGGSVDFDLGGTPAAATPPTDFTPEGTLIMGAQTPESTASGLDFDLGSPKTEVPAAPAESPPSDGGLDFDLKLDDMPGAKSEPSAAPATPDLSEISLDLGASAEPSAPSGGGSDPKWQEVATKLDLAKAYEEMGDKDGARELLNEVMKDGDGAQKGQAQQLLAKLG
jgi:pilus assembly protein FimV